MEPVVHAANDVDLIAIAIYGVGVYAACWFIDHFWPGFRKWQSRAAKADRTAYWNRVGQTRPERALRPHRLPPETEHVARYTTRIGYKPQHEKWWVDHSRN